MKNKARKKAMAAAMSMMLILGLTACGGTENTEGQDESSGYNGLIN